MFISQTACFVDAQFYAFLMQVIQFTSYVYWTNFSEINTSVCRIFILNLGFKKNRNNFRKKEIYALEKLDKGQIQVKINHKIGYQWSIFVSIRSF